MVGVRRKIKSGYEPWVRADERRGRGKLQDMGIKPKTLARYMRAVSSFLLFAVVFYGGFAGYMDSLDVQACEYLEYLWECGQGKSAA